jgi:hypothetical protein
MFYFSLGFLTHCACSCARSCCWKRATEELLPTFFSGAHRVGLSLDCLGLVSTLKNLIELYVTMIHSISRGLVSMSEVVCKSAFLPLGDGLLSMTTPQ